MKAKPLTRAVRVYFDMPLWYGVEALADERGQTITELIRRACRCYLDVHGLAAYRTQEKL